MTLLKQEYCCIDVICLDSLFVIYVMSNQCILVDLKSQYQLNHFCDAIMQVKLVYSLLIV
jgi:hypothetical protein